MPLESLAEYQQQLVTHYRWLRQYGCNDSHSGNASLRFHDQIWLTPTGCCADTLQVEDLVDADITGRMGEKASLDGALHIACYQANPQHRAVFHSHGPHAIALSMSGEDFLPIDFEGQYYFPRVPVITVDYARYVQDAPQLVADCLARHKVCMVRGHGIYAAAESINLAYKWSCSVEWSAKIAWLAQAK